MKGVILAANRDANVIDMTHEIPAGDIADAAFTLLAGYESFPPGTIHVVVVDPGVGSSRRPLLVVAGQQYFVGPDNGVFSYIIERESGVRVFHLNNDEYFRQPVSMTFHGRDVFAPVAAALANGARPQHLGVEIDEFTLLPGITPTRLKGGGYRASILHIDHFGNCVTSLTPRELTAEMIARGARLRVNGKVIKAIRRFFAEQDGSREKLFAFWGSGGFLELAALNKSAAKVLKAKTGQAVVVSTAG
jgi:S-adenosylmethionine hydrolase